MQQELRALAKLLVDEGAAVRIDCGGADLNQLMKDRCWQALMEIRAVLDDETLEDPECFQQIEQIVRIYEKLGPGAGARLCRRNPPPIFFSPRRKENGPRPVQKKRRWDEQAGRLFVSAGVGRIGPAGIDGPVVPVPDPGGRKPLVPHGSCGEKTGWSSDLLLLLFPRLPLR